MSVLETMLAYQVTSALQGGTGGRTISDQDVKYALKLFTGIFDSSKQRLSKLAMIRSMLNRVAVKSDMWNLIRPGKNVSYIRAVDRMLEVLDYGGEYNLDNFTNKMCYLGMESDGSVADGEYVNIFDRCWWKHFL